MRRYHVYLSFSFSNSQYILIDIAIKQYFLLGKELASLKHLLMAQTIFVRSKKQNAMFFFQKSHSNKLIIYLLKYREKSSIFPKPFSDSNYVFLFCFELTFMSIAQFMVYQLRVDAQYKAFTFNSTSKSHCLAGLLLWFPIF